MTRKQALAALKVAGYHGDQQTYARVYIEGRMSLSVAQDAFALGQQMRERGVKCSCSQCSKVPASA